MYFFNLRYFLIHLHNTFKFISKIILIYFALQKIIYSLFTIISHKFIVYFCEKQA